jgi:hypothetical protein
MNVRVHGKLPFGTVGSGSVSIAIQAETDRESKRRPGIKSKLNAYLDERRRRARRLRANDRRYGNKCDDERGDFADDDGEIDRWSEKGWRRKRARNRVETGRIMSGSGGSATTVLAIAQNGRLSPCGALSPRRPVAVRTRRTRALRFATGKSAGKSGDTGGFMGIRPLFSSVSY